jgi:hypothetical protein
MTALPLAPTTDDARDAAPTDAIAPRLRRTLDTLARLLAAIAGAEAIEPRFWLAYRDAAWARSLVALGIELEAQRRAAPLPARGAEAARTLGRLLEGDIDAPDLERALGRAGDARPRIQRLQVHLASHCIRLEALFRRAADVATEQGERRVA